MVNQIFDRDNPNAVLGELVQAEKDLQDIKATQVVGNDNLIVTLYTQSIGSQTVNANTTAKFKATFTFDTPPVDTFVNITFDWFTFTGVAYTYVEQRYDDPQTVTSTISQSGFLEFSPDATLTDVFIFAYANSTSKGTFTLTRLS